jgi:Zn-dependent peptidase ImmA (M78 family)
VSSTLRRGFKSEAEEISAELRAELGLEPIDPLDPFELAQHLGIPVSPLFELLRYGVYRQDMERIVQPQVKFSALTVCRGSRRAIFFNHVHSARRRANSISHEISHIVLDHEPRPALTDRLRRNWDPVQEAEADWLAGCLLVPRAGALAWFEGGGEWDDGADHFRVSGQLFRWRVNHTGIRKQLEYRTGFAR